jgi:hypothetical protein
LFLFFSVFRASLISPTNQGSIREEDDEDDDYVEEEKPQQLIQQKEIKVVEKVIEKKQEKFVENNVVNRQNNVVNRQNNHNNNSIVSADKNSSSAVETPPSVPVSVLNRKFSEVALITTSTLTTSNPTPPSKPIVTFTNQDPSNNGPPPVRRKSSELSTSMRSRLEAFISPPPTVVGSESLVKSGDHTPEPDEKFHEKLKTFRKISEGTKEEEMTAQRKPKLSYSSLIGVRKRNETIFTFIIFMLR